jgi:hypothetical protein
VLAHLPRPAAALARLAAAVRPGGWVLVEDVDFGGLATVAARYATPAAHGAHHRRVVGALQALLERAGIDPSCGARLPAALERAGLRDVGAELHAPFVAGGAGRDCLRLTVEYLRPRLVGAGLLTDRDVARFVRLTHDPASRYVPLFMVSAWGRRAA